MPNTVAQSDQRSTLVEIGKRIEDLFTQQFARIIFHQSAENEYRVREKRLSTLMLDKSISNEKHLEYAHEILRLIEGYKVGLIQPLLEVNDEIDRDLLTFQQELGTLPNQSGAPLMGRWLSLSKELNEVRRVATNGIVTLVDCDAFVPALIIKNQGRCDISLSEEESKAFGVGLEEAADSMKAAYDSDQKIQQEREPLAKLLFPVQSEPATNDQSQATVANSPTAKSFHPLEDKAWFRFAKVLYILAWIVGIGISALLAFGANEFYIFAVGAGIVAIVLIAAQKTFYYVILGRTTATEKPGKGFVDLEDFRNDLSGAQANNPEVYEEVIAPLLASWKERYGRRVPIEAVDLLQERIAQELEELRKKKQKLIDEAASKGATIEISKLRENIEKSKAEYKGADREAYVHQLELFLLSLESKYGAAIPVDEASKILDKLDEDIRTAS